MFNIDTVVLIGTILLTKDQRSASVFDTLIAMRGFIVLYEN